MICADTNVLIYISKGILPPNIFGRAPVVAPSVVKIEALGFPLLPVQEEHIIRHLLENEIEQLPLTDAIVERTIILRQIKSMGLADAIIAATALEYNCELWTANVEDFKHIDELKLRNPLLKK